MTADPSPARVAAERGRSERRAADETARRRAQERAVTVEPAPLARPLMSQGLCPACALPPESHSPERRSTGRFEPCLLTPQEVTERIARYHGCGRCSWCRDDHTSRPGGYELTCPHGFGCCRNCADCLPHEPASPVPAPTPDGQRDAESRDELRAELVELLRRYGLQIPTAQRWLDDFERAVERQIRDDERAKVLAEAFEAISARLGMAGDQTARMIALAALRSVSS